MTSTTDDGARAVGTADFGVLYARYWDMVVAYLRGQGRGRVRSVRGLDEIVAELGPLVVEAKAPQEGQSASGTYEGEGYVIVRHPETEVVEDALWKIVNRVRVELG